MKKYHDRYSMRLIKYIFLGIVLSGLIFLSVNNTFGNYYKNNLFVTDEATILSLKLKTNDISQLNNILDILKSQSKNNYSIIVLNNTKNDKGPMEYNFYNDAISSPIKDRLITFKPIDYSKPFSIQTGDGILFDPLPTAPIKISNVDFTDISENALIYLVDFQDTNPAEISRMIIKELEASNLSDLITIASIDNFLLDQINLTFMITNESIYIFIVIALISILILKDINNNFKEISLEKLEGISDDKLYLKFAIYPIILVSVTTVAGLSLLTYLSYPFSINLISKYYHLLYVKISIIHTGLLTFTLAGHYIIKNLKINNGIKGFDRLEYSIISLTALKILVLVIMSILFSKYLVTLPTIIKGQINHSENLRKFQDSYFINSTYNFDIDFIEEIQRIKPLIPKEHSPFLSVCLSEENPVSNNNNLTPKDYASIYYIIESDKNLITIDYDRALDDVNKMTFDYLNLDDFKIIESNLKTNDFIYCFEQVMPSYSKLYYKDYTMIKVEVLNIYDHGLLPNLLSFNAKSLDDAKLIIENIYSQTNTKNHLIIESREDQLESNKNIDKAVLSNTLITLSSIIILILIINIELIDNYIKNDHEENFSLFLLGKTKLFMLRRYIITNLLLIIILTLLAIILFINSSIYISPLMILIIIIVEIISLFIYSRRISFRKLR